MARINIEDSIFKDIRFEDLKIKTGSLETALGALIRAWSLAQKFYLDTETSRLIPITEWKKQRINPAVLECGLAEQRGEFIYVSGSEEQFKWLIQKQEAGKKGGRPSNAIKGIEGKPPGLSRKAEQSGSNPLTLTLPLSPSLSPSLSQTLPLKNINKGQKEKKPPTDKSGGSKVWDCYRAEFLKRYGVEPVRNAKVNSQCAQLFTRLGGEAFGVVGFYLKHNDSWFLKNQHDFGSLLAKAESIYTQWLRGQAVTSAQVRDAEKTIHKTTIKNEIENLFSETQEG